LIDRLKTVEIEMYEVSNFSKKGMESRHNSSYWSGKTYLGLGAGAHSFDGSSVRSWNVSNNGLYIKGIESGKRNFGSEDLTLLERYNEYVMTGLRRTAGINLNELKNRFNVGLMDEFYSELKDYQNKGLMRVNDSSASLTLDGFLLADKIASDFFR